MDLGESGIQRIRYGTLYVLRDGGSLSCLDECSLSITRRYSALERSEISYLLMCALKSYHFLCNFSQNQIRRPDK